MNNVNKRGLTEEEFLADYDVSQYDRPSLSVDMLIFTIADEEKKNYRRLPEKALRLLLVKRRNHPFMNCWALPGGFVQMEESIEEAARRVLNEETEIGDIYMEQLYTWGDVHRDPRTRVISTSYMALADSSRLSPDPGGDAGWFTVTCTLHREQRTAIARGYVLQQLFKLNFLSEDESFSAMVRTVKTVKDKISRIERDIVECNGMAFDHAKIIEYAIMRLRSKIEYTDIAFNLMPELFTLTELQQVYEVILDTELLKANFRRKIADMVVETDEYKKNAGHRPSKLFRFNSKWMKITD